MINKLKGFGFLAILGVASLGSAQAATVGAVDAEIILGGEGFGSIASTYNQSGLQDTYTSGFTNFDVFVHNTLHANQFQAPPEEGAESTEWFSDRETTAATVIYDLGIVRYINKMALWNEDYSGIHSLNLSISENGVDFTDLLSNLAPTNNAIVEDYAADVFEFQRSAFRFIRLEASGCPQSLGENPEEYSAFNACGIGEVAFNEVAPVPLPGAGFLLIGSLGGLGLVARRRRSKAKA